MSDALNTYNALIDQLRERRRAASWAPGQDHDIVNLLEEAFDCLSEDEQELVNSQGWRSWPDLFDERAKR